MRTNQGVETVDQFTAGIDAPEKYKEFRRYVNSMVSEYNMSGMSVYKSSRATKEWRNN
ncbi:MAG: hypothetical protein KGY51_12005 [Psychroflexus sp.]|nr:hypothetical protein [Psychroflexus sp.]